MPPIPKPSALEEEVAGLDGLEEANHTGAVEYIGIDPGASGGLTSILVLGGKATVEAVPMPPTEKDLWLWVALDHGTIVYAVLEQNTGYVGDQGNPGSAMFKFGRNHGLCEMALVAAEVSYQKITPGAWQRGLSISPRQHKSKKGRGESRTEFKNRLKARAQQLYPDVNVTLSIADSLLIAHYCRMFHEGKL